MEKMQCANANRDKQERLQQLVDRDQDKQAIVPSTLSAGLYFQVDGVPCQPILGKRRSSLGYLIAANSPRIDESQPGETRNALFAYIEKTRLFVHALAELLKVRHPSGGAAHYTGSS